MQIVWYCTMPIFDQKRQETHSSITRRSIHHNSIERTHKHHVLRQAKGGVTFNVTFTPNVSFTPEGLVVYLISHWTVNPEVPGSSLGGDITVVYRLCPLARHFSLAKSLGWGR